MSKKEDHNIPKDFEKTIVKDGKVNATQAVVGSTEVKKSKLPSISRPEFSKKAKIIALVFTVITALGLAGFAAYELGVFGGDNTIKLAKEEQGDEPDTPEQLAAKINAANNDKQADPIVKSKELGVLYLQKGDYKLAIANLNKALGGSVDQQKEVYSALAIAYYKDKQPDQAVASYEKLIELYSGPQMTGFDQARIEGYKTSIDRIKQGLEL